MRLLDIRWVIVSCLLAAPLTAQQTQTTVVPDVTVEVEPTPITNDVTVNVSDSAVAVAIDRLQASLDSALTVLSDCDRCQNSTTSTIVNVGRTGAIVLFSILGLRQLGRIADALTDEDQPSEDHAGN